MKRSGFSNICHSCRVHKSFQCLKFCICFYIWKKNLSVKINQCYFPSLIIYITHVYLSQIVYRCVPSYYLTAGDLHCTLNCTNRLFKESFIDQLIDWVLSLRNHHWFIGWWLHHHLSLTTPPSVWSQCVGSFWTCLHCWRWRWTDEDEDAHQHTFVHINFLLCDLTPGECLGWLLFAGDAYMPMKKALHLIRHRNPAPNGSPRLSVAQEREREVNPRSFSCTYVSCDLMCWQTLSAYFSTLLSSFPFLSSPPRDYLDYSGKTSEGNQETGRKKAQNYCCMTEIVALS